MITSITFFDGFVAKKWQLAPFWWFCCEKGDDNNVITFLYGGGVMKKVMASCDFIFLWLFWFSSLELTINNEMVVFLMLEVVMARGRRLKKGGGDLEVCKQNVTSLDQKIVEQNVSSLD
jgi:hypothetical protein